MTLSDDSWTEMVHCLSLRANEAGRRMETVPDLLALFRENWQLLCDSKAVKSYVAAQELAELEKLRARREADLSTLEAEIAAMKQEAEDPK